MKRIIFESNHIETIPFEEIDYNKPIGAIDAGDKSKIFFAKTEYCASGSAESTYVCFSAVNFTNGNRYGKDSYFEAKTIKSWIAFLDLSELYQFDSQQELFKWLSE